VQLETVVFTGAHVPAVQTPEQHGLEGEQLAPTSPHVPAAHVPDVHLSEQQSVGDAHASLSGLQTWSEVHFPDELQCSEQHWDPSVQLSPRPLQSSTGVGPHFSVALGHRPEQHWPGLPGLHTSPSGLQMGAGSVQIPLTHRFVQQFESEPQACPTGLQSPNFTQVPLHSRVQQSDGSVHVASSGSHVLSGPQLPSALHCFVQHSPASLQTAPSLLQFGCTPSHRPLAPHVKAEQHSLAATQVAPLDLQLPGSFAASGLRQPDDASATNARASPAAKGRSRVDMDRCSAMIAASCKSPSARNIGVAPTSATTER
jgi:hypothetical protein